jgi:hypothetical protein
MQWEIAHIVATKARENKIMMLDVYTALPIHPTKNDKPDSSRRYVTYSHFLRAVHNMRDAGYIECEKLKTDKRHNYLKASKKLMQMVQLFDG